MPKKKKSKKKKEDIDAEEIIIGLNSKKQVDNPPKSKKKNKKVKKKKKNKKINQDEEVRHQKPKKVKQKNEIPTKKAKKKKQKKKKRKGRLKKILKVLLKLMIVIAIAVGIILFLFVSPVFNIQEITVEGAEEISESVYIAMTGIEVGENIFGIDKNSSIIEVKKEPYVESIEINSIYPNKIEIVVVERTISYMLEQNGRYYYIDKNGYILEASLSPADFLEVKGYVTDLEAKELGSRLDEEDLSKFNDLIKIVDSVKSNIIDGKLTSIDIQNDKNYILEFKEEKKEVMLGDTKDLSAKMAWINLFMKEKKNESITIHLNTDNVYFSPKEGE